MKKLICELVFWLAAVWLMILLIICMTPAKKFESRGIAIDSGAYNEYTEATLNRMRYQLFEVNK